MRDSPLGGLTKATLCIYLALGLILLLPPSPAFCEGDPWYSDVSGHWAQEIIYVLWQEGVTDGFLFQWGRQAHPVFLPRFRLHKSPAHRNARESIWAYAYSSRYTVVS